MTSGSPNPTSDNSAEASEPQPQMPTDAEAPRPEQHGQPDPPGADPDSGSAETPGPTASQEAAPPTPITDPEAAATTEAPQPRRRVTLNPVTDLSLLRAVGSVEAVEQPQLVPAGGEAPVMQQAAPTGPVEIPDVDDLDADIQAQIEAALAAGVPGTAAAAAADGAQPTVDETGLPLEGTKLTGQVQTIHDDSVFLDVGMRVSAVVPIKQFGSSKPPAVGDSVEVLVEGVDGDESLILCNLPHGTRRIAGNWDDLAKGQIVDCLVTKTNKGGLEITVSNLRGFLPASQIDFGYVEDMEPYVGQKLRVQVTEVNQKKRNLIVSRRALLQAERDVQASEFWETVQDGQTFTGTVKTIKDYGAFINIGPVDGFLHIGEISWSRIGHPKEVLMEGQTVEVKVIKIDREKKKISLGMRQLSQNPWLLASEKYAPQRTVSGRVTRIADFGAFVELEPGIEGLVHVSELEWRRVGSVSDVLSVGQVDDFKVLEVDPNRKRISLSRKQLQDRPEAERAAAGQEADAPPEPARQPRTDLKGGTGSPANGGGLFGNPNDFT